MAFRVDDSRFPVLLTIWSGESTVDDIRRHAAHIDAACAAALAEGRSLALISDATAVTRMSPPVKRAVAALGPAPGVVVGVWVISDSLWMRGVMAALRWLNPAVGNVRLVASRAAAVADAEAALAAAR